MLSVIVASHVQADESKFAQLYLPLGVQIKVPKDWWVLDKDTNSSIDTMAEASLHLAGLEIAPNKETVLFRANTKNGTPYAAVSITAADAEFSSEDLIAATDESLKEATVMMKDTMSKVLAQSNFKLVSFEPLEVIKINGHPAMKMTYRRTGTNGDTIVVLLRLPVEGKEIALHTSYWASSEGLLKPVTDYIRTTIEIKK